ncbi:MAG TPA: hypothetical protein VK578_07615, partial [Edaphobacter sp.]|nr:hypothetical protein [Edaphobacter sp.]
ERKGRSAAKVCTSAARKTAGYPLRAPGAGLLRKVWSPCFGATAPEIYQGRVAAGTGHRDSLSLV